MTYYADLGPNAYVMRGSYVRAIGWLAVENPFPTGESSSDFIDRLRLFGDRSIEAQREIGWPSEFGRHTCEMCNAFRTAGQIAVPHAGALYVAPNMITHYVETHRYAPPAEFVAAVMASPLPGTEEYRLAVAEFRRLYWVQQKEANADQEKTRIEIAADWVIRHGDDDNALQTWKRMFWSDPDVSPKMCGSLAATLEYLALLEKQFFERVRERADELKRTKGGA